MKSSAKMRQIESKIAALQSQRQHLLEKRNLEISRLICKLDLASFDNKILMGGLLHLDHVLTSDPAKKESWRAAGEKFLRKSRNLKNCNTPGQKQPATKASKHAFKSRAVENAEK